MAFRITVNDETGPIRSYIDFGNRDDLMDVEGDEELAGKKLRKDEAAGKETFVSLLGIERAREQSRLLVDQAIDHLRHYGSEADLLRAIARFVVERDR